MPRPPRLELPGVPQHVIQRGNNRGSCFFGDADRRFYLKCLGESAALRGCEVHAYVLMSNHVHLLVTPRELGAIGAMMQDVGRRYVRVINTIHGRTGTLWESRFRSSLVDSETYLLTCHKYIELNPVRAGLALDPGAYAWSSHAHYLGERSNPLITEHPVYVALGPNKCDRRAAFRSLFVTGMDDELLEEIRVAINTDSAVGSESFWMTRRESSADQCARPLEAVPPKVLQENCSDPFFLRL